MENENEKDKEIVLASTNPEETNNSEATEPEVNTIKAQQLKDNVSANEKRDLSAIIPQEAIKGAEASDTLLSKDTVLKSDGAVVIGNIDGEVVNMVADATLPKEIDIESRKKEQQAALKAKKNPNKKKKELSEEGKRAQNITTLIVLGAIAFIGIFGYLFVNRKTDADFMPKAITVELGDKLPFNAKEYVTPGVGRVDDLLYTINTSEVRIDEVGDYEYTVYHSGITKRGTVSIVDTTPPKVKTKELHIIEGSEYNPESFVTSCIDLSGCEFSFKEEKLADFKEPGLYNKDNNNLIIVVKDPYDNQSEVGVTLYIEASGDIKKYQREVPYAESLGYSLKSTYEVHYSSFGNNSILSYAKTVDVYTYQNEELFNAEAKKHEGEKEVIINKGEKTITITDTVTSITDNGGTTPQEIDNYLISRGYTQT